MEKIRLAVIGLGLRGNGTIRGVFLENERCEIVALCDRHKARREAAAAKLGGDVVCYESFDEFINEKIDMFETFSKDFMNEEGYYIGEKLSKALSIQYPQLQGLEIPDIKPIDFFKAVNQLVGLEKLGQIIQTI